MSLEETIEEMQDTAKPFDFETYVHNQINYVHDLYDQARSKGDIQDICGVSAFMLKWYFPLGYDQAYRQYYCGMRHKPKWGEL